MRLVVLAVLACAALTSAQLGIVGSKVGSRVGADIGLLTGTMLDTVPSVIAMGAATDPPPPRRGPARGGGPRGPGRDQGEWDRDSSNERGRARPGERLRGRRPNPNYN